MFTGARIAELQDLAKEDFLCDANGAPKGIYIHGAVKIQQVNALFRLVISLSGLS